MPDRDSKSPKPKFYLTTPIYYANSRPHVGSAYTTIVCDVIARHKRMCGYEVAYLTGTDEHGVNIERAAEAQGISPQQLVDKNQQIFRDLWKLLGIQYTDFVRTTSPEHALAVQNLIRRTQRLNPQAIYKRKYEGRYCIYDNLYVTDTPEPANCEVCGRPAELISEENYFFRLSDYAERLLRLYDEHPEFVQPDFRRNEVISFVKSGLKDLSISRKSIKWGIPWPGDPEHVFYVWYDALTSYMSGIGFVDGEAKDSPKFKANWPADVHTIGKEIIRFHAVYWPAFLMSADLPLPKQIFAHGWLLFEQEKMSKSKGNVAYPEPIVKTLGNDALRYYLLRETVFGQDGNFSREALITRYNADLANGLGNLASRTLAMIHKYCEGKIPEFSPKFEQAAVGGWNGLEAIANLETITAEIRTAYDEFQFSRAAEKIWDIIARFGDGFLAQQKPWVHGENPEMKWFVDSALYIAAQTLWGVTILAHPIVPEATQRIWELFGIPGRIADQRLDQFKWGSLLTGIKIRIPDAVFPRVDKKEALEKIEAMENEIRNPGAAATGAAPGAAAQPAASSSAAPAGAAPAAAASATPGIITIDDFAKVQLRVAQIKSAERIAGADKLLKIIVDLGDETRQILAGIALAYAPEDLVGRKVVVVANLAPRKMRGLESNGMLLAASAGPDGKPVLCTFAEDIPPGAKVR